MFRQDRTNPSTAVSIWKGRRDTKKGWPSTGVSTWLNGGLFGAAPMTAFGGIITQYTDSGKTYRVHTFRGSGKFVVSAGTADCDVLVVGAGGSGSTWEGSGGGGGGGVVQYASQTVDVASSPYTITVGAGTYGQVGASSAAIGNTVVGGGLGASANAVDDDGACGGGGTP